MKKCEKFQNMVINGDDSADLQCHLAECRECKDFSAFHKTILQTVANDVQTPDLTAVLLRRSKQLRTTGKKFIVWSYIAGIAAMTALILSINLWMAGNVATLSGTPQMSLVSVGQLTAENTENNNADSEILTMSWDEFPEFNELEKDLASLTTAANWDLTIYNQL